MMGTLAAVLAGKKIRTFENLYWADVEGDIENVNNVLKITQIRVRYHLKMPQDKVEEAKDAFSAYLITCPGAQSVTGCIDIRDEMITEVTKDIS